jgi:hypothetical protein
MITFVLQDTTTIGRRAFDVVDEFAELLLDYAVALAAVGALAMVVIEVAKMLLDMRTRFHARRWTTFMTDVAPGDARLREAAFVQLVQLCTGVTEPDARKTVTTLLEKRGALPLLHAWKRSPAYATFAQDTEGMMRAVQGAADVVLASPHAYEHLFRVLTTGAIPDDVKDWLKATKDGMPSDPKEARRLANALARLRQNVKQKFSAFQVYSAQRWASGNQLAANIVGAIVMALVLKNLETDGFTLSWLSLFILSMLGGVLSPVAKDLVSALRRVRSADPAASS